jgi:dolichol-phosphate mannosyltransferase
VTQFLSSVAPGADRAKLAVIIPMFNEQCGAERCVREVSRVLAAKLPPTLLFVVDDGSSDNTAEILRGLEREPLPLRVVYCPVNGGYGAALLEGAKAARTAGFDFGLFMDSDLTNDPELIPVFENAIQTGVDVVKASRYIPQGGMSGVPWFRQAVSRYGNVIASKLCGIGVRDCTNGFRAVRLSLLADVRFKERGFPSIVEEVYLLKRAGAVFSEVPYILTSRSDNQDGSKFRYTFQTFYRYLKYCVLAALHRRKQAGRS